MCEVRNAHVINARFHGPTETKEGRFALSWRGGRLGTVPANARALGESGAAHHALAAIAAARLVEHIGRDHPAGAVSVDSVTVADGGPNLYSIHVTTRWT